MMLSYSVGYTARDLVYQWTAGRGVNIARYQHQIVMMMIPNMIHPKVRNHREGPY